LRNINTAVLTIQNPEILTNVNTPEDMKKAQKILQTNMQLHDAK
jgi:GTP:adenosylcobinamide-phosphate guanylyltransferase